MVRNENSKTTIDTIQNSNTNIKKNENGPSSLLAHNPSSSHFSTKGSSLNKRSNRVMNMQSNDLKQNGAFKPRVSLHINDMSPLKLSSKDTHPIVMS